MQINILLLLLLLLKTLILAEEVENPISANIRENKRNLLDFHKMIGCGTSRNSFHYLNYGCWCGLSGTGKPQDGVDRYTCLHTSLVITAFDQQHKIWNS